jgi:hypothetical protein
VDHEEIHAFQFFELNTLPERMTKTTKKILETFIQSL